MTAIALYGGPLKREIIKGAYAACGQSDADFELTPEELDSGCRLLNQLMARWQAQYGIAVGYNFPPTGNGSSGDESGIPDDCSEAVTQSLARRIAPQIGKTFSAEANANLAESMALIRSTYSTIPTMQLGRSTIRGAGNRVRAFGPFFSVDISDDEVPQ